jgi:hypothetical protein
MNVTIWFDNSTRWVTYASIIILVSSANTTVADTALILRGRSLIYIKKADKESIPQELHSLLHQYYQQVEQ